jgi:radical SAM protein with 4Fe4S-binding SPASM domain
VSSNGIVNTCCAEWGNFHNHGDARTQSLKDIWDGAKLRAFQMLHLKGERFENPACRDCQYRDCLPDNVDEHRLEMIERIK